MKREHVKSLIMVGFFMLVTGVVMGSVNQKYPFAKGYSQTAEDIARSENGPLSLSGHLVQEKILSGGDGTVSLALTLHAEEMETAEQGAAPPIDMIILLDQSGSMGGQKIEYARQAILNLLALLSAQDRLAIIGYADRVWRYAELTNVTAANRVKLQNLVTHISAGGNTNLGSGLQEGINLLLANHREDNLGKVILISDGLANRGIVDPEQLGGIASTAAKQALMVSTVGVGRDFDADLMATLANEGAGNFYYLQQPQSFVELFQKEFRYAKTAAAYGIEISIPLPKDVSLLKAAGYPITIINNQAVFRAGDLLAGETRKLFLTFQFPTDAKETDELSGITACYLYQGQSYTTTLADPFRITWVPDPQAAVASIVQSEWEEKVLRDEFGDLQGNLAKSLKNKDQAGALQQIDAYYAQQQLLNSSVGSAKVTNHLEQDLNEIRARVQRAFTGNPQEVEEQLKDEDLNFSNGQFTSPRSLIRK
jgi:Ca-activated chloride channel family protein